MEELLNLLRIQRHDFMNHLQVVSGYIQLDKCDQAKEYITQVSLELQKTGQIFKISDHELVLKLLLTLQNGFKNQVELVVDVEENIGEVKISKINKDCIVSIVNKIIELVKPAHYSENILINLDIDSVTEGYLFIFSFPNLIQSSNEALIEFLESQGENLSSGGIKAACNNLEENNELVITIPKLL